MTLQIKKYKECSKEEINELKVLLKAVWNYESEINDEIIEYFTHKTIIPLFHFMYALFNTVFTSLINLQEGMIKYRFPLIIDGVDRSSEFLVIDLQTKKERILSSLKSQIDISQNFINNSNLLRNQSLMV